MPIKLEKQQINLIIGIVLALIAIIAVNFYIAGEKARTQREERERLKKYLENQITVLVANKDIEAGSPIEQSMVDAVSMLNKDAENRAVDAFARIEGMVAARNINKGEQITLDKVVYEQGGSNLSSATPKGKRAVTIAVDNIASLAGMLKPGDYVDVIAMIPASVEIVDGKQQVQMAATPLFQNIKVLAVGQSTSPISSPLERYQEGGEKKEPSPFITLALTPEEANIITFVQEQSKIRLTLRSPMDAETTTQVSPATWDTVFKYIIPDYGTPPPPPPARPTVEIYRGDKKEVVPLSDK